MKHCKECGEIITKGHLCDDCLNWITDSKEKDKDKEYRRNNKKDKE